MFAIVFEYGRFNRLTLKPYQVFKDMFGDVALKHSMAVFTKCGSRTEASILNEMRLVCEGEPQHNICIIMNEIGTKHIVAFGDLKQERKARDRKEFLDVAMSLLEDNNDEPYPHDVFEEIREKRSRLVERVTPLKKQFHKVFGLYVDRMQAGEMSELEFEAELMKAESESSTFYKAWSNLTIRLEALPPAQKEWLSPLVDPLHEGEVKIEDFERRLREAEFFISVWPGWEHRVKALSTNRQLKLNPLLDPLHHGRLPIKQFEDQLREAEAEEWTEFMQAIVWTVLTVASAIGAWMKRQQAQEWTESMQDIVWKVLTETAGIGAWMKRQYQKPDQEPNHVHLHVHVQEPNQKPEPSRLTNTPTASCQALGKALGKIVDNAAGMVAGKAADNDVGNVACNRTPNNFKAWNDFRSAHRGLGLSREEMSAKYKAEKSSR